MEFHRTARKPATVSIVPLIDILVTLLFFFIVTMKDYEKKQPKPEMQIALPSAYDLEVKTTTEGRTTLSLDEEGNAEIDGLLVPDGLLKEFLVANLKERPGYKLALRADKNCPWEKIIYSHSAALEAGYAPTEIYYPVDKDGLIRQTPTPNDQ